MATKEFDVTLMGFAALDTRDINNGDIVVFRSTSITHSKALPLRHGRTARVVGFSKNRAGGQQISVVFKADPQLGDPADAKVTEPIALAPVNLVARTPESMEAAMQAHTLVERLIVEAHKVNRPWQAEFATKLILSEAGMYDRLGQAPAATSVNDDLPF